MGQSGLMRMWRMAGALLLGVVMLAPASAAELFDGRKPRTPPVGAPVTAGNTIGGYPIFHGAKDWTLAAADVSAPNNFGVYYGSVSLLQSQGNDVAAYMVTTANLNQASEAYYLSSDSCGGEYLVRVNRSESGRGDSAWDNCLTVSPQVVKVQGGTLTLLRLVVTISQSGSRYYRIALLLNPAMLGFPGSGPDDWSTQAVESDPQRSHFVKGVTVWGRQLQDAARRAIEWGKPGDAFRSVPDWRTLASSGVQVAQPSPARVAAASPAAQQARARPAPGADGSGLRVGDTLRFVDRDAISEAVSGTTSLTIDRIDAAATRFNGGAIVLARDGSSPVGQLAASYLYGYGVDGTARSARFHVAGYQQDVTVALEPVGETDMLIGNVTVPVVRYAVTGRASHEVPSGMTATSMPKVGAELKGELVVDKTTGLAVVLRIRSQHADYNIRRELVEILR